MYCRYLPTKQYKKLTCTMYRVIGVGAAGVVVAAPKFGKKMAIGSRLHKK